MHFCFHLILLWGGLKGIPATPSFVLGDETNKGELLFTSLADIQITTTGLIYLLDPKEGQVLRLDLQGKLLKRIGRLGQGPQEIAKGAALCEVGQNLWVADVEAGKIKVISGDSFVQPIVPKKIPMPAHIVQIGNEIFVAGLSLQANRSAIEVYSFEGKYLRTIAHTYVREGSPKEMEALWSGGALFTARKGAVAFGFTFDNRIAFFSVAGVMTQEKTMENFYPRVEETHNGRIFPAGYSAVTYSNGPHDSILLVTCSAEKRSCEILLQLTSDLKSQIGKREFGATIKKIRYFTDLNILALLDTNNRVMLYDTN